jgi:Flp pilus assembly protein TadG
MRPSALVGRRLGGRTRRFTRAGAGQAARRLVRGVVRHRCDDRCDDRGAATLFVVDDRGAATLFVVGVALALFALAGLVVDGGLAINERQRVADDTEQAARAGADRLAQTALRGGGDVVVDPAAARSAARSYLLGRGYTDAQITVAVDGDHVQVTATRRQPTALLSIVFINSITVSGQADARAVVGIAGEITGGLP